MDIARWRCRRITQLKHISCESKMVADYCPISQIDWSLAEAKLQRGERVTVTVRTFELATLRKYGRKMSCDHAVSSTIVVRCKIDMVAIATTLPFPLFHIKFYMMFSFLVECGIKTTATRPEGHEKGKRKVNMMQTTRFVLSLGDENYKANGKRPRHILRLRTRKERMGDGFVHNARHMKYSFRFSWSRIVESADHMWSKISTNLASSTSNHRAMRVESQELSQQAKRYYRVETVELY